jgi:hypothetical protein
MMGVRPKDDDKAKKGGGSNDWFEWRIECLGFKKRV